MTSDLKCRHWLRDAYESEASRGQQRTCILDPGCCVNSIYSNAMTSGTSPVDFPFTVTPFVKTASEKYNFGAVVENIDLGNIDGNYCKH